MVGFQAVGDVFGAVGNRAVNAAAAAPGRTEMVKEAIALGNQALQSLDQPLAGDKGERSEILLAAVVALAGVVLNDRKWLSEPLGQDSEEREEITISPLGTKQETSNWSGLPFTSPIYTGIPTSSGFPTSEPTSTVGEPFSPVSSGGDGGGDGGGGGDPLVFDLNDDGRTDATATQHGINVDGLTDTKWAAKGDGVLVFGNDVVGTDNKTYQDAYATLEAHAKAAGIDTSKGYLDAADIKKLEAGSDKLGMLVSNGDGTNKRMTLTELGITRLDLGHNVQQVNNVDAAGNRISAEGSFVRNGQVERVSDLWLRQVSARA